MKLTDLHCQFIKEAFKYLGWVLLFSAIWFRGCNRSEIPNSSVKVIVPETKGSFVVKKPIQVSLVIPSSRSQEKGILSFSQRQQNDALLSENISLKADFAKANDSIKKLQFAKSIELNKFSTKFEDENLLLNIEGVVQGEVKSISPNYTIKEKEVKVPVKTKETFLRLLGGLEIGNNKQLSNPIFKANLGVQNRKGNVITGSYDSKKNIYVGYQFSIFNIKR